MSNKEINNGHLTTLDIKGDILDVRCGPILETIPPKATYNGYRYMSLKVTLYHQVWVWLAISSHFENLTSGRVHLDVCWIDQSYPAYPVDCSERCSSRWTRPLVMSEEAEFAKRLVTAVHTDTRWCNVTPLRKRVGGAGGLGPGGHLAPGGPLRVRCHVRDWSQNSLNSYILYHYTIRPRGREGELF